MSISESADYALNHPAFRQAIKNHEDGHSEDLKYILIILQKEAVDKTRDAALTCYSQWKSLNSCDIKIELKRFAVPTTLDARMPIVKPAQSQMKKVMNKLKNAFIPNQLSIFGEFQVA